jgi:hypothetical protein
MSLIGPSSLLEAHSAVPHSDTKVSWMCLLEQRVRPQVEWVKRGLLGTKKV